MRHIWRHPLVRIGGMKYIMSTEQLGKLSLLQGAVEGTSMVDAGINDGDLVLIRCTNFPKHGAVQVVRYQDKSTLKQLWEIEGEGWELHYRDGTRKIIKCDSDDFEVQGEFVTVLREVAVPKE